jgi:NAD(P)-dependent dehydrogenase (short-subunit alcohol dehydrogenase family)
LKLDFEGKVAIVTGGTGAVGGAVAKEFTSYGARLAIPYVDDSKIAPIQAELGTELMSRVQLRKADMLESDQVVRFVDETVRNLGKIDILVNLIGEYFGGQKIQETEEKDWDKVMRVNLKSHFLSCKAVLPNMLQRGYGRIVNVASDLALRGSATFGAYSTSKSGIARLTETIADENREFGITANCVLPRIIDTPINRIAVPGADFSKWPKPQDVANLISFLASDEASWISGASVPLITH